MCHYALAGSALLALVASALPVHAQRIPWPEATDRIRVVSDEASGEFEVLAVQPESLVVRNDPNSAEIYIPLTSVTRLQIRQSRSRGDGALRGAGLGLLAGGAGGCIVALSEGPEWCPVVAIFYGGIGGILGFGVGAIFPGGRWDDVSPAERLSVAPDGHGALSIGYSLEF